jgi:SAM-dependent methyltransferase
MVADLDPERAKSLYAYVEETGRSERLTAIVRDIVSRHPRYLRVKELFETVEAYKRIGQAIYEEWRKGRIVNIYDLACGHGLLGLLFAHRFRQIDVFCVDLERRPAFDHYVEVARQRDVVLANLHFTEADLNKVEIAPRSYVVCIHACNEATQAALRMARAAGAGFGAMPCCIRDGIYIRRIKHVDDRIRYAVSVGVIAGQFGAYKVTAIDERITNRNLVILGSCPAA